MALNPNMQDHYGVQDTLDERQWSKLAPMLGQPYYVNGQNDLVCYPTAGQLSTTVSAGRACCYGFGADFVQQAVAHPVITSGSRYDLVAMRFDWTPDETAGGGNAYPVVLPGTSTKALPASRQTTSGVTYDMPLALAYVVAGKAQVQSYIDLRRFPSPIFARDPLTVPPEQLVDGQSVSYGGTDWYYRSDTKRWVKPQVLTYTDGITAYASTQVVKNPDSGWLLSQVSIPDPGFPYSIVLTGQLELDPITRTEVWAQYAPTTSTPSTDWVRLFPQFFTVRGTGETKTITAQFIPGRTGPTVLRLLARVNTIDLKTGATFSTKQYNGRFQAMVIPL